MFWGLSEALDLFTEYLNIPNTNNVGNPDQKENPNSETNRKRFKEQYNILIFGGNDPRHIIKTMAKLHIHRSQGIKPILNFYIVDGCIEIAARNMILLGIALENPNSINLRTKVHLFMDIYGNSLLRSSSYHYLAPKAKSMIKAITDDDYMRTLTPMISIEQMKYRERDGLENAFAFLSSKEGHSFKIQEYWNARLRKTMGTRYDYREGQFDWDLNMVLKDREGKQICSQEYRYWRETGIAFTFPEFEYSFPNKTLSAGLIRNGNDFIHRGYLGDIQTGPFAAFGLKTNDERMTKSVHGENDYRSTDITERNLLELFYELSTQTPYEHDPSLSHKYGAIRLKMGKCLESKEFDMENAMICNKPWIFIEGIKINFLSTDDILTLQQNVTGKWTHFFDVAFVGHNYFTFLKDDFVNILAQESILILETKLLTTSRKEEVNAFDEKLFNYAKRNHLHNIINYNALNLKNSVLRFKNNLNMS